MKKIFLLNCLTGICFFAYTQKVVLDPLTAGYFTPKQIDTMSQEFIKAQNYFVRYSWNIYGRWDKKKDSIIVFNRDTVDIRIFLKARKPDRPVYIYDAYPGLMIELDSKNSVDFHLKQILSGKE